MSSGPDYRGSTTGIRRFFYVAASLVFAAGVPLFVGSTHTGRYFAWTIKSPLTAAFLGANYWAAIALEVLAARQRVWARVRVAYVPVLVFTLATLVVTLVHLDRFHLPCRAAAVRRARAVRRRAGLVVGGRCRLRRCPARSARTLRLRLDQRSVPASAHGEDHVEPGSRNALPIARANRGMSRHATSTPALDHPCLM